MTVKASPVSSYPKQWATIFTLLYGTKTINPADFKTLVSKVLGKGWEIDENPVIFTEKAPVKKGTVTVGHWKGRKTTNAGPFFSAVKWNVRKKDHSPVTDADLGAFRGDYRSIVIPLLKKLGLASEYITARVYSIPFDKSVDKGLPSLPSIPPEPKAKYFKWLLWLGGGVATVLVLKNFGKKKPSNVIVNA